MKLYFGAAHQNNNEHKKVCRQVVEWCEEAGHEVYESVLSEHIPKQTELSVAAQKKWVENWIATLSGVEAAIFEASYPAELQVGFEMGMCVTRGKPTILLHKKGKDPAFINSLLSARLIKSEYSLEDVGSVLEWCLDQVKSLMDRRFTFFIPPEIDTFLEQIVVEEKVSRSAYIRSLIEEQMNGEEM